MPPLVRSSWVLDGCVTSSVPSDVTRSTVTVIFVIVTESASLIKVEPAVDLAVRLTTEISRWLPDAPMAAPAVRIRSPAAMSVAEVSVPKSRILPAVAITAPFAVPALSAPRVTLPVAAS
jgi:hypothetical protein